MYEVKVKGAILLEEIRRGGHLSSVSHMSPVGGYTTDICDAWPVPRQTYGYLPSCRASSPFDRYQSILLGVRGTCVKFTHMCNCHQAVRIGNNLRQVVHTANSLPKVVTWKGR